MYSGALLFQTPHDIQIIHLSGHMFGNQSPFHNRKCLTLYPDSKSGNGSVQISEARLYTTNSTFTTTNYPTSINNSELDMSLSRLHSLLDAGVVISCCDDCPSAAEAKPKRDNSVSSCNVSGG